LPKPSLPVQRKAKPELGTEKEKAEEVQKQLSLITLQH
jgi:hypothetical protein